MMGKMNIKLFKKLFAKFIVGLSVTNPSVSKYNYGCNQLTEEARVTIYHHNKFRSVILMVLFNIYIYMVVLLSDFKI